MLANKKVLFKVNGDEETALHLAARRGHVNVLEVLLNAARLLDSSTSSANDIHPDHPISLLNDFVWHPNRNKDNALHLALSYSNYRIASLLVEYGSPRYGHDFKNKMGETPVYLAVKLGNEGLVRVMCEYWEGGVALDGPDDFTTVLHAVIIKFRPGMHYIYVIRLPYFILNYPKIECFLG